jgi:putative ABC transport system permease protein
MIKSFFKIAWRNLWRNKRMTSINIAGLGIGMAAAVLIAMWVQNELSFDRNQPDANNIYRIKTLLSISKTETWVWESSPYMLGDFASRQIPQITGIARMRNHYHDLNLIDGAKIITEPKAAYVDEGWFKMFHYDFVDGSPDAFVKNPFSIILTESTAKRYFGNHEAVGKVLRIDTNNYQVQGVVRDQPANSSFRFNVLMPVAAQLANPQQKKNSMQWGNYNFITFVKLRPNANTKAVSDALFTIQHKNHEKDNGSEKFSLTRLTDMHFETDLQQSSFIHGNRTIVNVFVVLAGLLLITACINYVNLTTARASMRSKEVSVRKIVGAARGQLFRQFMSESLVVSLVALVLALVLIEMALPWFRNFTDKPFGNPLTSPVVLAILSITLLVSFLLNGLYPAMLLSSFNPMNVFRGKSVLNFKDVALRRTLVVAQFTISVVLIVGTLVIYRQLRFVETMDPGYNRSQVLSFTFPYWTIPHFDYKKADQTLATIKQELKSQAATSEVSMAGGDLVNFGNASSGNFDWKGRPKDFNPSFAPLDADVDFQKLMQVKMKEGRWFTNDVADKKAVILNETAVALTHLHEPIIGQRFVHQGDTGFIVGVAKDFHYKSLHEKIGPMVISNNTGEGFYIRTQPGNASAAIAAANKIWKEYFPDSPFVYEFLDDTYNNLYKSEQQSSVLITLFASIAIIISALGLLGLAAFAAEQKVKEIGIRKVLGASVRHIVGLLSVDFVKMVVIASIIAFPIAWWAMNKWLQDFAYKVNLSWWIFAISGALALTIALITVSYQAIKAALANPVKSLRSE